MPVSPEAAKDLLAKLKDLEKPLMEVKEQAEAYEEDEDAPTSRLMDSPELMEAGGMDDDQMDSEVEPEGELGSDFGDVDPATHNARAKAMADAQKKHKAGSLKKSFGAAAEKAVGRA